MAYALTAVASDIGLIGRFRVFLNDYKAAAVRAAQYRKTVAELSGLSNHELADIGISRGQIEDIATAHANG
ncbi:protein of unknown function [Shimia gijangensis]|uniref:YjiS-like domain-containing protein n=1 Tax=Shimia gijangensis TaxID=1470563 RepID=A0A1M6M6X2_9RHOB|nr:DUF1127 domain-containing protein [Shimia gijangensis]SHJ79192.1 protein of unknown function [Shimia gijangensis]